MASTVTIEVTNPDQEVSVIQVNSGLPGAPGVGVPVGGTIGQVLVKQSGTDFDAVWVTATPGEPSDGTGDVVGPASVTDGRPALFDGTTGKLLKQGAALGTAAFTATDAYDAAGAATAAAAAAQAASQPLPVWSTASGTTPALVFAAAPMVIEWTLSGDSAPTASGYAQGRHITLLITGDSVSRNFSSFPSWTWLEGAPTDLAASQRMRIDLFCAGSTAASVTACYAVQAAEATSPVIRTATTTFNDAQIKALPTTALQVVVAPGVGKIAFPVFATVSINTLAGAYVIEGNSSLTLTVGDEWFSAVLQTVNKLTVLAKSFGVLACPYIYPGSSDFESSVSSALATLSSVENQPIKIGDLWGGIADYTGGNAANTMKVTVHYVVKDV